MLVFYNISGITYLPFIMIPFISTMSSQNIQYILFSCDIWSSFSGHPIMMYPLVTVSDHLVQLPVVFVRLTCILDGHHCLYCIYLYVHALYLCIFVLCMFVSGQPICNEKLWSWIVYYPDSQLVYPEENALYSL